MTMYLAGRQARAIPKLEVLIDIETSEMTLSEVMKFIEDWKQKHPGESIHMDGDMYVIVREVYR